MESLNKYLAWYDDNKVAIEAELKIREAKARAAVLRKADRLERKAKALRKKVKNG